MKFRLIGIVASTFLLASAIEAGAQSTAEINFGSTEQTVRGFGGSDAWLPQFSTAEADTLFGTGSGQLGLSILRVRIDPSSVTGGNNWATERANAQMAQAHGAIIIATPWTPPAAWKTNGSIVQGSLKASEYAHYADYLNLFATYMASDGVPLYAISMQNEPSTKSNIESCLWTGAEMDAWVAGNAGVLKTKLMMPESETFDTAYSDPALDDANAVGKISIIAGHLYGKSPFNYTKAKDKGKEVWMTEHYLTPPGPQPGIADALAVAGEIHRSLVVANYNAYMWWWVADRNYNGKVTNYGLIDTNITPTYYGLALGQFSRFVRPGYLRVGATANPVNGVGVSAYSGNGQGVIVAINSNSSATAVTFAIRGALFGSLTPYETSATSKMMQLSAVAVAGKKFTYTLPAQSITTFTGAFGSEAASTTASVAVGTPVSKCAVEYKIVPQDSDTFAAKITIKNGGTTTLSKWKLTWSFANGQNITSSWNGAVSQNEADVTVSEQTEQAWEDIPAGGSYSGFGFNGAWDGVTNAVPTDFSLNGTPCTVN
jgi:glucuronoarabinoxylan endo-1,4-beta-xylanase